MKIISIDDLDSEELKIYTRMNEKQVKRAFEPDEGAFICESGKVIMRALEAGYELLSVFADEERLPLVKEIVSDRDIPVYLAEYRIMKNITGYSLTGGILAAMRRRPLKKAEELLDKCRKIVILDDIENPTNVGAIFRSAAALGADGILLTDGSADPLYRRAARVSMGTVFQLDWTFAGKDIMEKLKEKGFESFALALKENAEKLNETDFNRFDRKAVIMGNEDHGISEDILDKTDHCVIIPMYHGVDSLNVAAASAVAFWEIFRKSGG